MTHHILPDPHFGASCRDLLGRFWRRELLGFTSAHVVIRTGKHPERVPPEVLREAARLCALHSAAKHSHLVPVDYTLRKHVVKRRGSPPGEVQYTHEKTLDVEPGL